MSTLAQPFDFTQQQVFTRQRGLWSQAFLRLRQNRLAVVSGAILGFILLLSVLAEASTQSEHWPHLEAWAGRVSLYPAISFNGDALLTITAPGVDKGSGLLALCRHLGIDPSHAVAIGDSEVDIPMFNVAGLSVAMADGTDEAKAAAMRLTGSADEDGVAMVIEGLL